MVAHNHRRVGRDEGLGLLRLAVPDAERGGGPVEESNLKLVGRQVKDLSEPLYSG